MNQRYIALLIVALIATSAVHAQTVLETRVVSVREALQSDPVLQLMSRATPAEDSRLDAVWYHDWENNEWKTSARTLFVYEGAYRTEQWEYFHNGEGLVNDRRTLFAYDGQHRLQTSTQQNWDAGSENFLPSGRERYFYVGSSRIATDVHYEVWDGGANDFIPSDRDTYSVETVGGREYITGGESFEWIGGGWVPYTRFEVVQQGSDVVYTSQDWEGGTWVNDSRSIYLGVTIDELYAHFEQLMADLEEVHGAYLALRLPDALQQTWDGSEWVDETRQVTERYYDVFSGAIIRTVTTYEDWEDDEWIPGLRQVVSFEIVGNGTRPDSLWYEVSLGDDEWMLYIQEAYEYDTEGRLVDIYQEGLDWFGTGGLRSWTHLVWSGASTSIEEDLLVRRFHLEPAYPNPFNPQTTLRFSSMDAGTVTISVFDMLGRRVATLADGQYPAGEHVVRFEAAGLPSGTYLVRMEAHGGQQVRSVTLLK
jgi:hypothetical protein